MTRTIHMFKPTCHNACTLLIFWVDDEAGDRTGTFIALNHGGRIV